MSGNQETSANDRSKTTTDLKTTDLCVDTKQDAGRSIYIEALLLCCIVLAVYFAWYVFAMGSGGVLYHGY